MVGRGRGGLTGDPFRDLFRGEEFSCMAVGRAARKHTPLGRLIAARLGDAQNAWGFSYGPDQAWHSGIRPATGAASEATVPDAPGAFRILTCVWKKSADEFRFRVLKPDGTLIGTESILRGCRSPGPIREIRLGAHSQGNAEFFAGDLAEILLYHRALTTQEIKAAEEYLLHKYFR